VSGIIFNLVADYSFSVAGKEMLRSFIYNIVDSYIREYPVDKDGKVHAKLVRLEVEAVRE